MANRVGRCRDNGGALGVWRNTSVSRVLQVGSRDTCAGIRGGCTGVGHSRHTWGWGTPLLQAYCRTALSLPLKMPKPPTVVPFIGKAASRAVYLQSVRMFIRAANAVYARMVLSQK